MTQDLFACLLQVDLESGHRFSKDRGQQHPFVVGFMEAANALLKYIDLFGPVVVARLCACLAPDTLVGRSGDFKTEVEEGPLVKLDGMPFGENGAAERTEVALAIHPAI